jgi:hypothetical protein
VFAACIAVLAGVREASAAADVRRFSLVLSANPTSIDAGDFNKKVINRVNDQVLFPRGLGGIENISFGWLFDTQLRYFVRPNVAIEAGVGQLRSIQKREYLPRLEAAVQYRAEVLTVPVHVGGAYYLPPYNQGDFQARFYLGGGFLSQVFNRARLQAEEAGTDTATTLGGSYRIDARRDSPGYYGEMGVHMFFASRFSVMIGALYRSQVVRDLRVQQEVTLPDGEVVVTPLDQGGTLDLSGLGGRFAVAIGF